MEVLFISAVILCTVVLFVTETIPIDLTAFGIMVVLMATGILPPAEALSGFANPAVITVGAMFIISRAMMRTGALGFVDEKIIAYSRGNRNLIMVMCLLLVAIPSAFLNNTPVVVLFISILMAVCCEYGLSPSRFLIPVSYASILAGTCTLIGTSTNLLVSDLSSARGYGTISMFELATLGVPMALLGLVFLYFAAPLVMPGHKAPICELKDSEDRRYLAELEVPAESKIIGRQPPVYLIEHYPTLEVFELIRGPTIYSPEEESVQAKEGDILFLKASASDLVALLRDKVLALPYGDEERSFVPQDDRSLIVELIVPPQSRLLGIRLVRSDLHLDPDIKIIAVKRRRVHYSQQKLRELRLTIGDILLVQCPKDHLDQLRTGPDFIVVEDVHHQIVLKAKAPLALAIFAGMVVAAATGLADIMVCAVSAVFLLVLAGCLQLRDAYRSVDVRVLLMIVGTLALGSAMEKTGAAQLYADNFLSFFGQRQPAVVLSGFILLTSVSTQILSNNATAVLLIPIGISSALSLGVDPRPFIIAICYGASACYATPIGYQTNLMVFGPGGYRFTDYLKLGIPLNLMIWAIGSLFIPVFWPF
jgi:di/tricarboxylate transporter